MPKTPKKSRMTPESISNNVDFLGLILRSCSPADFEYWRKQHPFLPKAIKAGLRNKFNITF